MRKKQKSITTSAQLQLLADEAAERAVQSPIVPLPIAPAPTVYASPIDVNQVEIERPPFGLWLVNQHQHRRDWIAVLAKAAKADHRFPKAGAVDQVREYLTRQGADGDAFEALDDAEREWLGL